jgi:hypothetical protein
MPHKTSIELPRPEEKFSYADYVGIGELPTEVPTSDYVVDVMYEMISDMDAP